MRAGERSGAWWALAGRATTIVLTAGARTSLPAFIRPIEGDLGLDRGVVSTAGVALLGGLAQLLIPPARVLPRILLAGDHPPRA